MPKQSAITRSKSAKETQEEAVKLVQSQQHKQQRDILDITLLPPRSTLYLFHTPLWSPHFDSKQTNADIVVTLLALEFKQTYVSQQSSEYSTVKPNLRILNLTQNLGIVYSHIHLVPIF